MITSLKQLKDIGISSTVLAEQLIRLLSAQADKQPQLYELCDQLLDVARASDPFIRLIAVLLRFCESHKPRTAAMRVSEPGVSAPIARIQRTPLPHLKSPLSAESKLEPESLASHPASLEISADTAAVSIGGFDWDGVMAAAKKHNPPLYSVLSRARIEFADNILTLHFVYALHRKKLEQPQYHAQLSRLIHDICAISPEICVKDGRTMSEEASAVAEIMGGGELTHAR